MEAAIETLTKKKKIPFLFLGKEGVEPTLEARKYSSSEKANKYISAIAIVIEKGNLAHKIFGNILLTIDKRPNPIKIFTTENKSCVSATTTSICAITNKSSCLSTTQTENISCHGV